MPFSAISLLHSLDLKAGDWIVQNTANGAVGRMVAQIAKARGIHVIGLVRRRSAVAELAEQGIDNVVSTDAEGWRDAALALADGARIVAGVDSVGGSASNDVLSLLSENGTLVIFGSMGAGKLELSAGDIIFRQATVKGFWAASSARRWMPRPAARCSASCRATSPTHADPPGRGDLRARGCPRGRPRERLPPRRQGAAASLSASPREARPSLSVQDTPRPAHESHASARAVRR